MTVMNALNGLVSDLLDRLAERVASRPRTHEEIHLRTDTHLVDPSGGRALIAKMARSEVKNYLAELAEQAGVPFTSPVGFITMSREGFESLAPKDTTPPVPIVAIMNPDGSDSGRTFIGDREVGQ